MCVCVCVHGCLSPAKDTSIQLASSEETCSRNQAALEGQSEERSEAPWNRGEQLVQGSTGQGTLESNVQGRPRYMH